MATILSGTIKIGNQFADASAVNPAIDNPRPLIAWTLPSTFRQQRFSIKIANIEVGGFAEATSGAVSSVDGWWQLPPGLDMNSSFNGLCTVDVAVSASTTGDFEAALPTLTFVFNRSIQKFFDAEDVSIRWHQATDPDRRPGPNWRYDLQVAADPLFNQLIYAASGIIIPWTDPVAYISHDAKTNISIPNYPPPALPLPTGFAQFEWNGFPEGPVDQWPANAASFFRVRAFDGLDYGNWSIVYAFYNYTDLPPTFRFISVTPTNNEFGDVLIIFQATDPDSPEIGAEITFQSDTTDSDPEPISLLDSTIEFSPGTWCVTWRSGRQLPASVSNVVLYGIARDEYNYSNSDQITTRIDNSNVTNNDVGLGTTRWNFPAGGELTTTPTLSDYTDDSAVDGDIFDLGLTIKTDLKPVALGQYVWWQLYLVCPSENYGPYGPGHIGNFAIPNVFFLAPVHDQSVHSVYWAAPMAQVNVAGGPTWDAAWTLDSDVQRSIPVSLKGFIFNTPFDTSVPSTIPTPMSSRDMAYRQFLRGYYDLNGVAQDYPNGYDWVHRPNWHIGREIWDNDDAWVQVGFFNYTSYDACETCNGRGFVGSGNSPPYSRVVCPNPNCFNGFDHTKPLIINPSNPKSGWTMKVYADPQWYRFNAFMQKGQKFGIDRRKGLNAAGFTYPIGVQFVMGDQLTTLDQDKPVINGKTRTLPSATPITWTSPFQYSVVVRQGGSLEVAGALLPPANQIVESDLDIILPVEGGQILTNSSYEDVEPVQGHISSGKLTFSMSGPNTSNPLHDIRPQPTQKGSLPATLQFERSWNTSDLKFRFLPAWWDDLNTLHIGQTGGSTSKFQIQYAAINPDNSFGIWSDVVGENATYDPVFQAWLIDPLTFHEYFSTADKTIFPDGQSFKLRVRQYDPPSNSMTEWVYSHAFSTLHGVANPVNMLSMIWEPWAKTVTITLRIDDTQNDTYNLLNFWYSYDNGITWLPIARGDITGAITNLTTSDGDPGIKHVIVWQAAGYDLQSGDNYRINIECLPTNIANEAQIPLFRWVSPPNPIVDEAISTLADVQGRMETLQYDPTDQEWTVRDTPVFNPGQLYFDQQALERVRDDATSDAPDGIYTFITLTGSLPDPLPSGSIPDVSGYILPAQQSDYNDWLQEIYSTGETHSQALSRINAEIQTFVNVTLPAAQVELIDGERTIRKTLINQGYYAEQYFQGALPSGIVESVSADVVSNNFGSALGEPILRQWTFEVQNSAINPTGDPMTGQVNPDGTITVLEVVYYQVQLDSSPTYDSQPFNTPLRDFLYNFDGNRLNVSTFYGGRGIRNFIPNAALDPNIEQASDQSYPIQILGGTMTIAPADLPGQHASDVLPNGMTVWDGSYHWRISAYNAFNAANTSQARPLIFEIDTEIGLALMTFSFNMFGHFNIQSAALSSTQFSNSFLTNPIWTDITSLNYVSDRRAISANFNTSSTRPWIPVGTNRPHPCIFWDNTKLMYLLYTSKITFDGVSWRPINSRSMALPNVCEYEDYFETDDSLAIYHPVMLTANGQYWMFVSVQPPSGSAYIGVSTSPDAETWSAVQPIAFATNGIDPSVYFDGTIFHLWYEIMYGGKVQIAYATSADGFSFTMQNSGAPVYGESTSVSCPSVIKLNGFWVMYFNDSSGNIASVISSNGISWTGRQVELSPTTLPLNGFLVPPVAVTPKNPYVFVDNFGGNQEVFLAFNYLLGSGTNLVYIARLEDRVWINGIPNKVLSLDDPLSSIRSSRNGTNHQFTADMAAHGLSAGQPISVRVFFGAVSPATLEYHRQSAWVDPFTLADPNSYMSPQLWSYNSALLSIPYMSLTNG